MANITRFSPFEDAFDELFKGFLVRPVGANDSVPARFQVDIVENEKAYTVRADLPGVKKEDINVAINGNEVAISAETRSEREAKDGERVLRSERRYGKVHRAFSLGQDVDEAGATAKYADGVLELTLPKKVATSARHLTIQ
ncbi:MAG TPA: Hsp20/alpha crystallin family protein [Burkholderiales bacterium]|nr:Hsp20/alpha crystallin family protein [Burkholderiales bacterium]